MPVGYDFYALRNLLINNVLAFTPGQLVPDTTVDSQGWTTGTDVQVLGDPPPSPSDYIISLDTDGVPYIQAVS